ncbi:MULTISPECIES: DUF6549 family protein [Alistipes]|jgi:hypothetical protein|uniref:DUF6549 family protein n=1 Tax=Alistipes TaxID=239759 RepID=UPI00259A36FF|nr:DUF6549 family protein [Alistipes communis]
MSKVLSKYLLVAVLLLSGIVYIQYRRNVHLANERDRYQANNTALLSEVRRMRIDSTTLAVDTKGLRLTVEEYKRFRAQDAETIKKLGVKIKNLEAAAKHQLEVEGPIDAVVKDTVFIRDTVPLLRQKVEMITPHIQLTGMIEDSRLKGQIRVPVTLNQAIWVEYKGWWFWKRVKAIHQSISSDNPYVDIKYTEYIQMQKGK